jgi:hypothetical protein
MLENLSPGSAPRARGIGSSKFFVSVLALCIVTKEVIVQDMIASPCRYGDGVRQSAGEPLALATAMACCVRALGG